ncbi:MAG: hypothetical protein WC050_00850 [Candidatus Paceibacterota bacterium]
MNDDTSFKQSVMQRIAKGSIQMRPRWHFVLLSTLFAVGVLIFLLALMYAVSLLVFFLHQSGAWFAPSFGARGWFSFFRSLPWLLVLLLGVFVIVLEVLVRRYSFVYKKSLLTSVLVLFAAVLFGGFAVSQTPLHRQLTLFARHGVLPPFIGDLYRPPFRLRSDDVFDGVIVATTSHGVVMSDEEDDATTSVIIGPHTRLPYGANFTPGDRIIVVGDRDDDVIEAFGIREVENEEEYESER